MFKKLLSIFTVLFLHFPPQCVAQRSYTFNAVSLNVDGLPEKIAGITINSGAPGEAGAAAIGNKIRTRGWDIMAVSEDFNFHTQLVEPIQDLYYIGTHGGGVSGLSNSTDGLGLFVAKKHGSGFNNETRVKWTDHYGEINNGADGLINKGFRYYTVSIADGIEIDLYCLHMDAEDSQKDNEAREKQMTQLVNYIKGTSNGRPILILGDTNCRYTRDKMKELLIDAINSDERFTIHDAWIELIRDGVYPNVGDPAIMTSAEGPQRGEVVDKIFWIENSDSRLQIKANSYLHDTAFDVSDHFPLVVNFTITDPAGTPATSADWTLPETAEEIEPEFGGCEVAEVASAGSTEFLMPAPTKKHLKSGATWGTHAVEGIAAMPLTLSLVDGKYRINSFQGSVSAVAEPYMDNGDNTTWSFEKVEGIEGYQYIISCDAGTLASTGETASPNEGIVKSVAYDADDKKQRWVLLTEEKLKELMQEHATAAKAFNATPLIKGAAFDRMDGWTDQSNTSKKYSQRWWDMSSTPQYGSTATGEPTEYVSCIGINSTDAITMSQTISSLPAGTYSISVEALYRSRATSGLSVKDHTVTSTFSFAGQSADIKQCTSIGIDFSKDNEGVNACKDEFNNNDTYKLTLTANLSEASDATVQLYKAKCTGTFNKSGMLCADNCQLWYYGNGTGTIDPYLAYKNSVAAYANATWQKVALLNDEGQQAYDISLVISRYNSNTITSDADVAMLKEYIDEAYTNALKAAAYTNGDMTALIQNASFETGDMTGWTSASAWDVGVYPNSNSTYTADGCDGDYIFNSYNGDGETTAPYVYQTITGVRNGLYEVKALLTSFANHDVFLIGNHAHTSIKATDKTQFTEATLLFLVDDGNLTIGAVGGSGTAYDLYMPTAGCFFKADNFRVRYVCDAPHGRLKLAIDDAEAVAAGFGSDVSFDISAYKAMYENMSLTGNGDEEVDAIYSLLAAAAKQQRTANADMTAAIVNPSFERGSLLGWTAANVSESKAAMQDNGTYTTLGCIGTYLFNTWQDTNSSSETLLLQQTVTGLPNGQYRVSANVTSGSNNMVLTANGASNKVATSKSGEMYSVETVCEVTDGNLDIKVNNDANDWFKADNFRLEYLGRTLTLEQTATAITAESGYYASVTVNRNIATGKWNTLVLPFSMDVPSGWEVKALANDTWVDEAGTMHLRFNNAENINAGQPYMIRVEEDVAEIKAQNVEVDMASPVQSATGIDFVGVYTAGAIPAGVYFISNNTFYHAVNDKNTIKGFRAYLQLPAGSSAKAIDYTIDGVTTAIDGIVNCDKVKEVYDIQGRRRNGKVRGLSIMRMENGEIRKNVVK